MSTKAVMNDVLPQPGLPKVQPVNKKLNEEMFLLTVKQIAPPIR